MTFKAINKQSLVKGALISAANSSGKSRLLAGISRDEGFSGVCVFEMDSLKYYRRTELERRLPLAQVFFESWFAGQASSAVLEGIYENIELSDSAARLIKFKFIELMAAPEKFITVLPQKLSHDESGVQFIGLIEEYFKTRLLRVALIPSISRYAANLYHRKRLNNFRYVSRGFAERRLLISQKDGFDEVFEISFFGKMQRIMTALREALLLDE